MNPPPHDVAAGTGLRIIIMHFHFLIWRIANNPPVTSSFPSFLRRTKIHAGAFDRFRELHARIFAVPSIQESPVQQQPATTFFFRSRCAAADETIGDQLGFEASLEPPVPFASPQLYFKQPGELVLPSEYMSAAAAVADLDPSFLLKPAVAAAAAPPAGIWRPVWLVLEQPILVVFQLMRRVLFPLKCWSPCLQQSPLLQIGHDDHQHLSISFFPSGGPSSPRSHSQIADGGLDFAFILLQTAQPVSLATPRPTSPTTSQPTPLPTPQPTPMPTPPPTSLPTPQPTSLPTLQPTPVPTPQRTPLPTPHRTPLIRLARNKARIGLPWPLPRSHASHLTRSCLSPQRILAITPTPRSRRRSAPTPMPPQPSHLLRASVTLPLGTPSLSASVRPSLARTSHFAPLGLRLSPHAQSGDRTLPFPSGSRVSACCCGPLQAPGLTQPGPVSAGGAHCRCCRRRE